MNELLQSLEQGKTLMRRYADNEVETIRMELTARGVRRYIRDGFASKVGMASDILIEIALCPELWELA